MSRADGFSDAAALTRLARRWAAANTRAIPEVPARRVHRVAVAIPAVDEAETIGPICAAACSHPLVDEVLVVDGGSTDATASIAAEAGARVLGTDALIPGIEPVRGKGDAMWRSLAATDADIIAWVDGDLHGLDPSVLTGLIAPLLLDERLAFVKAAARRPLADDPDGGGRVTELLARPLLALAFPELTGFAQPLAGEYAGRREVLTRVPFFSGYAVEVGLLIDLLHAVGLDAMAQVDVGVRVHRNRSTRDLAPMAHAIARAILMRAEEHGRLMSAMDELVDPLLRDGIAVAPEQVDELERPPMASVLEMEAR